MEIQFGEWIPVKEEEPNKSGHYLVTNKNGKVFSTDYHYDEEKVYWEQTDEISTIAWMKFPEQFKENI